MLTLLDKREPAWFPDPSLSDDQGLVAVSESLGPERIKSAYQRGIFPWMKMDFDPHFGAGFLPILDGAETDRTQAFQSMERVLRQNRFEIRVDSNLKKPCGLRFLEKAQSGEHMDRRRHDSRLFPTPPRRHRSLHRSL